MRVEIVVVIVAVLVFLTGSHSHHEHDHEHQHEHEHKHHHQHQHHSHHHEHHHHNQNEEDHHRDLQQQITDMTPSQKSQALLNFFTSMQRQVDQWVYLPRQKPLSSILQACQMQSNIDYLLTIYIKLAAINTTITKQHVNFIFKQFKTVKVLPDLISCIVKQRSIENHYLQQKKKLKYMAQMINRYPSQGKDIFPQHTNFTVIGQKLGRFFKALFEYYYLQVLNPSETLSTEFLRALTVRSPVFQHQDLAFCIAIDSVGKLSQQLQDIDINNVYIKIPEIYDSLRFLKLKETCKDSHNKKLINNLHTALEGLDMFKIMYKEYQPFVEIAAEKMVQTQIRLLARKFSEIIANRDRYLGYSKQNMQAEL